MIIFNNGQNSDRLKYLYDIFIFLIKNESTSHE